MSRKLYEEFHQNTKMAKRFPGRNDFALANHLPIYERHIKSGDRVLDIGCGAGPMSLYFARAGARVKGVDLSENAISECLKAKEFYQLDNLEFCCESFIDYADTAVYDAVMMTEVLEHLPDDRGALEKINCLLNPGGVLLFSVPSINAPLHKKYMRKYGRDPFDERVGHLRRYSAVQIFNLLFETGFELIEFRLCEGYLRNWLFNDRTGLFFMKFNRLFMPRLVSFIDDYFFTPLWGESDIIIAARKAAPPK